MPSPVGVRMTFVAGSSVGYGRTIVDDVLQAAENCGLPIERKGRITDDIQEKNVRSFGLGVIQRRHGCSDKEQCFPSIAILTDECEARFATSVAIGCSGGCVSRKKAIEAGASPAKS